MPPEIINIIVALTAGLFTVLIVVIGWIGSRVHTKLDDLSLVVATKFDELNKTLIAIERDLRDDLHDMDRRIILLETMLKLDEHDK
jgi:hypothetical protein